MVKCIYMFLSSMKFLVGPAPGFGSVRTGYAPSPVTVHAHSDNMIPMYILIRNMKKIGTQYHKR